MNKSYHFLPNTPIGEDKFEGQSQEKIANVLKDILCDPNFQIIGIDGTWGTGKSNLVEIVNKKLPNHKFFIYDVWGHQEDEQRRAILLELTESLSKDDVIKNKESWEEKLQILLSKKKSTTTLNQPYLGIGFILSLLAIVYVPLVNVFVDKGGYKNLESDWWRIGLVGLPIILILVILLSKVVYQLFSKKNGISSFKIAAQQTFQVYNNKQEQETKIETISESEPSVQEFRDWMKEIDSDLKGKKLVLVFDNFDRLPKKHISSIWSSLHVFFSEEKYKNIKVIVPFDREHIRHAFKEMNGEKGDYSNDYINKTFDLVYRVSPPILSSWKTFFKENWQRAFLNFNETEYLKAEQAYEILKDSITPREIIAFINEVVSLKLLQDDIPERYIAVFVLKKEYILEDPLKAIVELNYLKGLELFYSEDEDYQKCITALVYQIDQNNALEVVYKRKLKESLLNKDVESFNEIAKTDIFDRILQSVLNEIDDFRNPIEVLEQLPDTSKISEATLSHIWNDLFLLVKNVENKEGKLNTHHKILLEKIEEKNQSIWLEKIIHDLSFKNKDIKYFINSIDSLESFVKEKAIGLDVLNFLPSRKIEIGDFITLIELKGKRYSAYNLNCNIPELDEHLKTLQIGELNKALFLENFIESKQLESFKNWLIDLASHHKSNSNNLGLITRLLKYVSDDYLPIFVNDAELYALFTSTSPEFDYYADLIVIKIKHGIQSHPSFQPVYDQAINGINQSLATKISKQIGFYMSLDEYLIQTVSFNKPAFQSVTQSLIDLDLSLNLSDEKVILNQFDQICQMNSISAESLFKLIDQYEIDDFTYEYVITLSDFVFENAVTSETGIASQIIQVFKTHFDNYNLDSWIAIFSNLECREMKLLQKIEYTGWNGFALEALRTKLLEMVKSGSIISPDIVEYILINLESSGKDLTNTFKDVRDELISARNINENLFTFLFKWLVKYGALNDKSDDVLRTKIVPSLLDSEVSLDILISEHITIKTLKDSSSKSAFNDFKDGIIARKENQKVQQLAELLSIKIPKGEAPSEEETEK